MARYCAIQINWNETVHFVVQFMYWILSLFDCENESFEFCDMWLNQKKEKKNQENQDIRRKKKFSFEKKKKKKKTKQSMCIENGNIKNSLKQT